LPVAARHSSYKA